MCPGEGRGGPAPGRAWSPEKRQIWAAVVLRQHLRQRVSACGLVPSMLRLKEEVIRYFQVWGDFRGEGPSDEAQWVQPCSPVCSSTARPCLRRRGEGMCPAEWEGRCGQGNGEAEAPSEKVWLGLHSGAERV